MIMTKGMWFLVAFIAALAFWNWWQMGKNATGGTSVNTINSNSPSLVE